MLPKGCPFRILYYKSQRLCQYPAVLWNGLRALQIHHLIWPFSSSSPAKDVVCSMFTDISTETCSMYKTVALWWWISKHVYRWFRLVFANYDLYVKHWIHITSSRFCYFDLYFRVLSKWSEYVYEKKKQT